MKAHPLAHTGRRKLLALLVLMICSVLLALADHPAAQRDGSMTIPRVSTLYVSALDRNGAPVTSLVVADVVLKEGGRTREIVRIERATAPMQIAIIVDDSGSGIFRFAVANFIDPLIGHAQFAIRRIVGQVQSLVEFTSDVEQLRNAVISLKVRADTPKGGQVVEAVYQAAEELQRREAERPIIVVLTDTDAEYSSIPAEHVLERLRNSGAMLYVITVAKMQAGVTVPGSAAADKPSDLLDRQLDVNRVLGDGPKQSGGRLAEINRSAGPIPALQGMAAELGHQYLVTYIVPAGEKPGQKISVSSKRRDVSLRAPSRAGRDEP